MTRPMMKPIRGGLDEKDRETERVIIDCEAEIKMGSRGEEVRILQEWINRNKTGVKIKEDGIFGPITLSNLRQVSMESFGFPITSTSLSEIPGLREYCV